MFSLNLFIIGGLSLTICCVGVILVNIVFGRKKVHYIWSLFNLSVAIWGFGAFMVGLSHTSGEAWFWWKINHIGVIWIPVFVLHTVYLLTNKAKKRILIFAYVQAICFQIIELLPFTIFFKNLRLVFSSFYYVTLGYLYHPFFVFWVFLVIYAHICAYKGYITSSGTKKVSLLYFLIGSALGFSGGVTNFLIGYKLDIPPYGNFTIPIYCITVTYAIIKYRLMDIRVFISRAVAFLISYSILLVVPFFFAFRMYPVLSPCLGIHWWLVPVGLLVFFASMAPLAYEQIRRGMENTLLAEQKKYQKLLLQAASGMVREHNISHLCKLIVYIVKKIVKVNFAAIFLYHKEKKIYQLKAIRDTAIKPGNITFLTEHPFIAYLKNKLEPVLYEEIPFTIKNSLTLPLAISLIVPSSIENELLGFVILGEKLNREPYSEDDINVFKILSHQAAMAVENCLFFEEFKSVQQKIFTAEKLASIGGMADGVAHQIKNRLNHFSVAAGEMRYEINDFIERHCALIEQNPDLKKSFNYILDISGSIIDNVKRTDDVVRGILNYARVEEKGEFFSHFSLKEITDVSLGLVTMKHEVTEAPLECDMGADDIIYGVKPQIMECIFNLLDNHYEAIMEKRNKFSDEQRLGFNPLIKLKLTQTSDISLIEISDNGIGIKEEDKSKIFAPFFTTKSSYKSGSGIGMYVVKRIIEENHKGKISFESAYMQGTKFVIELPRK